MRGNLEEYEDRWIVVMRQRVGRGRGKLLVNAGRVGTNGVFDGEFGLVR